MNLKDRIAALQQRNAGSSQDQKQGAALANGARATGSLRDKIASFEKQGAVPVPRGSFGLGAPPVDDGSSRRRGELIGNRVPGLSRPVAPVPTHPSRATSPTGSPGRVRAASATIQSRASSRSVSPNLSADGEAEGIYSSPEAALEEAASPRSPRQSAAWQARRRSVSDIVAKFSLPPVAVEPLPEGQEEGESSPLAVNVSPDSGDTSIVSSTAQPSTQQAPATDREELSHDLPSQTDADATDLSIPAGPVVDSPHREPDTQSRGDGQPPPNDVVQSAVDVPSPPASPLADAYTESSSADLTVLPVPPDNLIVPTAPLPNDDAQDHTVVSSPSPVATSNEPNETPAVVPPCDDVKVAASQEVAVVNEPAEPVVSTSATSSIPPAEEEIVTSSTSLTLPKVPAPLKLETRATVDPEEFANQSLALDTHDAVIVTEPPRVVTPIMTRAVLVPVSPISPARSDDTPPAPTPTFVEPSLTPKSANGGSFRAVVHRKVTSGSKEIKESTSGSRAQRVSDLRIAVDSPQSPGFTDLADLMADAALLEQQLSGLGSPKKLPTVNTVPSTPPPASALRNTAFPPRVEVTMSEQSHISDDVSTSGDGHGTGSSEYNSPQEFPSLPEPRTPSPVYQQEDHRRSRAISDEPKTPVTSTASKERPRSRLLSDTPPPVPPKSPRPRYFSTLLSRRPSSTKDSLMPMPGAYPRDSVCSEMSEDDSVLATPPSPRFDHANSDAISVVSSTRSWKMPSKGLARATSFADRLWSKRSNRNTVVIASPGKQHLHVRKSQDSGPYSLNVDYPDDDSHLSANTAARPRKSEPKPSLPQLDLSPESARQRRPGAGGDDRPTSWVSVASSLGSGGLDSALFDAFPSVPDTVPAIPLDEDPDLLSHAPPPSDYPDTLSSRSSQFPPPRSSSLPKQRSAFL